MTWIGSAARSATSIAERYWGYAVLAAWGGVVLASGVLRFDPFGIEEPAARALLLAWSVGERVQSTIFVLGLPDLRALLFAPLAAYWPGSIIAAKVYMLLAIACAAALLYRRSREEDGAETALLATGLLLISPITVLEADVLGAGPFLLLSFTVGSWLDRRYRTAQRPLGGWYFTQLLWLMIATSLHPAAMAYPAALAWEWKIQPVNRKNQRQMLIGIVATLAFVLAMRLGWPALDWLANPITSLSRALIGGDSSLDAASWVTGSVALAALMAIGIGERRRLASSLMRRMMVLGLVLGLACADGAWAMLAVAALLYLGIPRLLRFNQSLGSEGFAGNRGITMAALVIVLIVFTRADKAHHFAVAQNHLPPVDALMLRFAAEIEDVDQDVLTMTQWPGKAMLALRRPALPLPPDYPDADTLIAHIKGVNYLLFDPKRNAGLAKTLAERTDVFQTMMVEEGGVAVHIRSVTAAQ